MAFFQIGRLGIGWGSGNNRFVKTNSSWFSQIFNNTVKEVYATQSMNEYEIYSTTGIVYIVFNRFAAMFSNGIWKHQKIKTDGTWEDVDKSDHLELLNNPNPIQNGKAWMIESCLQYLVYGNRITYPIWGSSLSVTPRVINNLPPQYIKIKLTGKRWEQTTIDGIIEGYILENYGSENKTFKASEIIHHKNVDTENPFRGKSCLESLHMEVSNIRGAMGFRNVNIMKRGALGAWVNQAKDEVGPLPIKAEDRLEVDKQFSQETHGILDGQSAIAMLSGNVKWENTAYPLNDMMLFEEITEDMMKVIDAVNLNDNIFSKSKGSTYANMQEGLKSGYENGVIPFACDFSENITQGLRLPNGERVILDYSHLPVLKDDEVKKSQISERNARAISALVTAGYTPEEASEIVYGEIKKASNPLK